MGRNSGNKKADTGVPEKLKKVNIFKLKQVAAVCRNLTLIALFCNFKK